MITLPTHWEQTLLIALLVALPIMFLAPLLLSLRGRRPRQSGLLADKSSGLALWRRGLCVLLAYIMLLVLGLESIAQGATQYNQLNTTQWANGNRTIEYQYDDNGSLTQKSENGGATWVYGYNLLNQLEFVACVL